MVELKTGENTDSSRGTSFISGTSGTHSVQMLPVKTEENGEIPPNSPDANVERITATGSTNDGSDENGKEEDGGSSDSDIATLANS